MMQRSGVFTPVVIMVLTVFAILGVTYSFTGASSYGQSAQTILTVKAGLLAQAALEEAQMVVYDRVNRPPKEAAQLRPEWKNELLTKVEEEVKAKESGTGPIRFAGADDKGWINLLQSGMVEKVKTLAPDLSGDAEITECKVKFYGFRRIPYNEKGDIYKKESFYRNELLDKDVPDFIPNDFIGYYTIRATAKSRGQTKSFAVTHDIKIVNCAPIAHEFGLFQMQDVPDAHKETDLIGGGAWRLYPRGFARIYMKGPYTTESEGFPDGNGGYGPADPNDPKQVVSNNFLKFTNNNGDVEKWEGWHLIPNPRAGISKRAALVLPRDQVRPYTKSTSIGATIVGELTNNVPLVSAAGPLATSLGADPGLYIPENEVWYTGFKDHTGKEFSLCGEPRGKAADGFGFSCFRGEVFRLEANNGGQKLDGKAFWPAEELSRDQTSGVKPFQYVGQYLDNPPGDIEKNWYIAPEAFLKMKCHVVRFKHPGVNWTDIFRLRNPFNLSYNLELEDTSSTPGGVATQLYGLHWEPVRTRGILDSILDGVFAITPIGMFMAPIGFFPLFNLDPRAFFSGSVPGGSEDFKDVRQKSLPSNYKGVWSRAATRMYKKLSRMKSMVDAKSSNAEFAKLMLDGVLWSNDMKLETPIQYTGKGIMGGEPANQDANEAVVQGPVVPVRPRLEEAQARDGVPADWQNDNRRWSTENYLTLIWQGVTAKVADGNQMMLLKLKNVGSRPLIDASVLSTHGVKPDGTVTLHGNLTCNLINKSKMAPTSTFILDYNDRVLARRNPGAGQPAETAATAIEVMTKGQWHNCAVSPRISGYLER